MCHECMPLRSMQRMKYCECGFRQFPSPQEEAKLLEEYREQLQREIEGVEQKIKELKKE